MVQIIIVRGEYEIAGTSNQMKSDCFFFQKRRVENPLMWLLFTIFLDTFSYTFYIMFRVLPVIVCFVKNSIEIDERFLNSFRVAVLSIKRVKNCHYLLFKRRKQKLPQKYHEICPAIEETKLEFSSRFKQTKVR